MAIAATEGVGNDSFPAFGYDVKGTFVAPQSRDNDRATRAPGLDQDFVRGILWSVPRFLPPDPRSPGEIQLGFLAGDFSTHPSVLWAQGLQSGAEPVHTNAYGGHIWRMAGQLEWQPTRRVLDVDLKPDVGEGTDVRGLPERRGLALTLGLAFGAVAVQELGLDPQRLTLDVSVAPNFLTEIEAATPEARFTPAVMAHHLAVLQA